MEYGKAAAKVTAEVSVAARQLKKAHGGDDQESAQPALQCCGNYGRTGRNT
jgi:hypothetical protein